MKITDIPSQKFPVPFATSAGSSYKRTVPQASQIGVQNGAASFVDGFPPLTMQPIQSGGVPVFGQDMNGLLFAMTSWARWAQAGGPVTFDSAYSSGVGGYPKGAVVQSVTDLRLSYVSAVDDNTTDPDSSARAGWYVNSPRGAIIGSGSLTNVTNLPLAWPTGQFDQLRITLSHTSAINGPSGQSNARFSFKGSDGSSDTSPYDFIGVSYSGNANQASNTIIEITGLTRDYSLLQISNETVQLPTQTTAFGAPFAGNSDIILTHIGGCQGVTITADGHFVTGSYLAVAR